MAANEVAVCNMAVAHIGGSQFISTGTTIASSTDATNVRRLCAQLYDAARDFVLADYPWKFAERREALAGQAAATGTQWSYKYDFPADAIQVLDIRIAAADEPQPFELYNDGTSRKILTNVQSAIVVYTARVVTTTLFESAFTTALSYYLGSQLAVPLVGSVDAANAAFNSYQQVLAEQRKRVLSRPDATLSLNDGGTVTELTIANTALAKLGHTRFMASITEDTNEQRLFKLLYYPLRDQLQRDFNWLMGSRRITLTAHPTATPPTNWLYVYNYPANCARFRKIIYPGLRLPTNKDRIPFEIGNIDVGGTQTKVVFTDQPDAEASYSIKVTDPALFDPLFTEALTCSLAAAMGPSLQKDMRLVMSLKQEASFHASKARAVDLNEEEEGPEPECELLSGRNG